MGTSNRERGRRSGQARNLAVSSVICALCVVILLIGCLLETMDLTTAALCGVLLWFLLLEYGYGWAAGAYFTVTVLSLLLLPTKTPAVLFAGITGWYPLLKRLLERLPKILAILLKFAAANAAAFLLFFLLKKLLGLAGYSLWLLLLCLAVYNLAFFLYDVALTRLIWLYISKLRPYLQKAGLCKK